MEISTIIKIISTVSKKGIDGLAKEYKLRVQIHRLSHRHMWDSCEFKSLNKPWMLFIKRNGKVHQKLHRNSIHWSVTPLYVCRWPRSWTNISPSGERFLAYLSFPGIMNTVRVCTERERDKYTEDSEDKTSAEFLCFNPKQQYQIKKKIRQNIGNIREQESLNWTMQSYVNSDLNRLVGQCMRLVRGKQTAVPAPAWVIR